MTVQGNPNLHNPHLEGDAFFWPGGPVGVFLSHGYTATAAEVRPLAEKLRAKGYTVTAPLLPGHGTQPRDLNRVRWQEWVEAGAAACQELFKHCERVFVGGESMGGVLALYLASQNPHLAGVLLYAPALRLNLSPLDKAKLYLGAPFLSEVGRNMLDCSEYWQGYPGLPLKGALQLLRFAAATEAQLANIHQPVLVFQGRRDVTVAPEAGEVILNGVRSTLKEHHWMEKTSHAVLLDVERDQVNTLTMQFIEKCLAQARP
jgi:carboxylesterase